MHLFDRQHVMFFDKNSDIFCKLVLRRPIVVVRTVGAVLIDTQYLSEYISSMVGSVSSFAKSQEFAGAALTCNNSAQAMTCPSGDL